MQFSILHMFLLYFLSCAYKTDVNKTYCDNTLEIVTYI